MLLVSYERASKIDDTLHNTLLKSRDLTLSLEKQISGSKARSSIGEKNEYPTIWSYLWSASGSSNSTYGPTQTHKKSLNIANKIYVELKTDFESITELIKTIEINLKKIGAPAIKK